MDRTITKHDNQPPLDERLALDHADLLKRATEAIALVPEKLRPIADQEEAAAYTETAADILTIWDEANEAFEPEKKPWRDGSNTVDTFFVFRKNLKSAADRVKAALGVFQTAQAAAQRRADEEAATRSGGARRKPLPKRPARKRWHSMSPCPSRFILRSRLLSLSRKLRGW